LRLFDKGRYFRSLSKIVCSDITRYFNTSILITGANGLIGGTLLDFFMYLNIKYQANIRLIVIVRSVLEKHSFFDYEEVTVLQQSVTDPIIFKDNVDYIYHTASNAHPRAYDKYPVETIQANVQGTSRVLEFARQKEAIVIFTSSSEVYGEFPEGRAAEDSAGLGFIDPLSSRSCYGQSKRMAESLIAAYHKEYGVRAMSVRPSYVYGARFSDKNTRADVEFIKCGLDQKAIIMESKGLQLRSYCYVIDCVCAMLLVGLKGKYGEAYNISSDSGNVRLFEFAQSIAHYADIPVIFDINKDRSGKITNSLLSNEKIKQLGWKEHFSLIQGIEDTFKLLEHI